MTKPGRTSLTANDVVLRDEGLEFEHLEDIMRESENQIEKWGNQEHTISQWMLFLTEELGELAEAIADFIFRNGQLSEIRTEAAQVSALALKMTVMCAQFVPQPHVEKGE